MKNKSISFFGNIKKYAEIPALLILVFFAVIIAADRRYLSAVSDGAALWAATIFPALLPYTFIVFIVSSLKITGKLARKVNPLSKRLWNINGNGFYALTVSLTSGYPLGSKTVADLKSGGFLGEAESVRAAALCSSSSPAFIIASVGSITFCNTFFGVCLFVCHVLSVFSVGFVFAFYKRKERPLNVFMAQKKRKHQPIERRSVFFGNFGADSRRYDNSFLSFNGNFKRNRSYRRHIKSDKRYSK